MSGRQGGCLSSEIVNTELFDLVFEKHRARSVALSLHRGKRSWLSHVGKYRRSILEGMDLDRHLPVDILGATMAEIRFTREYHERDGNTVILFPNWTDCDVFEQKLGSHRMKIANKYIIKWKAHWSIGMVYDAMSEIGWRGRMKCYAHRLRSMGARSLGAVRFVCRSTGQYLLGYRG